MAVVQVAGFETRAVAAETGIAAPTGTAAISTVQARTGTASMRCNPASGAQGYFTVNSATGYHHVGVYIATLPSVARMIGGSSNTGTTNLLLNPDGTISVRIAAGAAIGTSSVALATGRWYWIGWHQASAITGVLLQIDGVDQVTGTSGVSAEPTFGCEGTEASAIDLYFDDVIFDNAGFLKPSKVALLVPISDNAVGAGWNLGTGTSVGNRFPSVANTPPLGVADLAVGSDPKQIRNAASNLNAYAANLTTYTTAGVGASDTVIFVEARVIVGAPSATSPKSGSLTLSNPTVAKASFGNFYAGSIAGTYPSGWQMVFAGDLTAPTLTLGSSPVLTVTQDTSSTRIAMVCFMGVYVAWTPVSLNKTATPGKASLTLTSFAPTVRTPRTATPSVATLATTAYAPAAVVGHRVTPAVASLTLSGLAPTVTATASVRATPGTATLTLTGFAPSAQTPRVVTPPTVSLTTTGFAPTVATAANATATPGVASLTLTRFAPTVSTPRRVTVGLATSTLTGFAPSVTATARRLVTPGTTALTLSTFAPTVTAGGNLIAPHPVHRPLPTPVLRHQPVSASPGPAFLWLDTFAPTVEINDDDLALLLI